MKTVSLSGSLRENVGKKDTKALRQAEMVPCVMYGSGEQQIHFATSEKNFSDRQGVACRLPHREGRQARHRCIAYRPRRLGCRCYAWW